jgi:hypothetical protein
MNESTAAESTDARQQVQIGFRDGLTPEQRDLAERSVAAMLARARDAVTNRGEEDAKRGRLEAAVNAPLAKTIEEDREASAALKELGNTGLGLDPLHVQQERFRETQVESFFNFMAPLPAGPIDERRPPYDYTWAWGLGGAPISQRFFAPSGFVSVEARSGNTPGGAASLVDAHAGYGVALSSDHSINLVGRVETLLEFRYQLATAVPGSWADAEGGIEITAFEDPVPGKPPLADTSQHRLWRAHKGAEFPFLPDTEGGDRGPFTTWDPWGNIRFRMNPGHGYTFNVGIRAFANHGGAVAAAGTLASNYLIRLSMERIG